MVAKWAENIKTLSKSVLFNLFVIEEPLVTFAFVMEPHQKNF